MADRAEEIDQFINRMYGVEREQPIENLIHSLDTLPIALSMPMRSMDILYEVKKKMYDYRKVRVSKKIMKKLVEVIISAAKTNKVDMCELENTFKESPRYDLDTSNTIILPEAPDETQYEFKSILEDVEEGANHLAEKTQNSLELNIGLTDKFIINRKNERQKRLDEFKEIKDSRNTNILPRKDSLYNWNIRSTKPNRTNDKCHEILSRINDIIEKSENPNTTNANETVEFTTDRVKKLESYESHFNQKMLTLLSELSEKLAKPENAHYSAPSEGSENAYKEKIREFESDNKDTNVLKESLPVSIKEPQYSGNLVKYAGVGMAAGICMGAFIMFKACGNYMPY
ncbi:hypothetical protein NEPAR06_1386 [Nematocida parisii]|uniref:uncharacterized protein n=1 Tax=Nematocida parisii (strain ERTm1 / ATCC PRA-289) TaxID=881290 RepID=UPI000264BBB6|nr:uncharacterized protein NEPG_00764 [Nematocida parisii ERTm1]KAI5126869.1 hypothetical protein NEPAR03_0700 [Nematocida parisii]EIJ94097.1 hypothetical protein NEPG_00764 [Nematocida parisii ERTm1]KAI5126949.1 hypothetical protein NEPAR08_0699 [Nematocida parisii]KAI5141059.1 hypothetical protein NEPAR04_0697 [Nematocida parisii]KAI5154920.1 hypothetical protein NEPAR06_1386 [Nematocida parisii]|eukprot:XP_013058593.1 hypothetical protein NEPG_00764 [Nematocida parisii ERTm1]